MPFKSLKYFATVAGLVVGQVVPAFSKLSYTVKAPGDLKTISAELQGAVDKGFHVVDFSTYANVGKLTLDNPGRISAGNPASNIDSILLTRDQSNSDTKSSDAIIQVADTLMDLKSVAGTVILRGLAFHLTGPKSVLIAGAETGRENGRLVMEDCSIYADSLEATFLSWAANLNANVEIRRCFFVSRGGKTTAQINLKAGSVFFSNNLFNFPGLVATSVNQAVETSYNTVNRTQFKFTGEYKEGKQPLFRFIRNFIAYPPAADALNVGGAWVLTQVNFDVANADVKDNRLGLTWAGFDYVAPNQNNILWLSSERNLKEDAAKYGKKAAELWNWYLTGADTLGLQSGPEKRASRYNVLPSDSASQFSWTLPGGSLLTAYYQPVLFPREIKIDTGEAFPAIVNPFVRPVFPRGKALRFGAFNVDRIRYDIKAAYGTPVLVVKDSTNAAAVQDTSKDGTNFKPSLYKNALGYARSFQLADFGNTARGENITPVGTFSGLAKTDSLIFKKVDSAGLTNIKSPSPAEDADSLRFLNTNFGFLTTAVVSDSVLFGSTNNTPPYWPENVFWYFPAGKTLVPALKDPAGKMIGRVGYSTASGIEFKAHLVEKLTVKKGASSRTVTGGSVNTFSNQGFQMRIVETANIDPLLYGNPSKGFTFFFAGRGDADQVQLILKGNKNQNVIVTTAEGPKDYEGEGKALDSAGNFRINILKTDTGKTFFLAIKYNVQANTPTSAATKGILGATIENFKSSTPGKLTVQDLDSAFFASVAQSQPALADTRFLGGKALVKLDLNSISPFTLTFGINPFRIKDSVEAWAYLGKDWLKQIDSVLPGNVLVGRNLPAGTEMVLVVERFAPPENYVTIAPKYDSTTNKLTISPAPTANDNLNPVSGYCVELQSFGLLGDVETISCAKKAILENTELMLMADRTYQYRIRYFIGADVILRPFQTLAGPALSLQDAMPEELKNKAKGRWYLVGFPFEAPFYKVMKKSDIVADSGYVDTDSLVELKSNEGIPTFPAVAKIADFRVKPGEAYLFASARAFSVGYDSVTGLLSGRPFSRQVKKGWNFISNPYPSRLLKSRIRASGQSRQYIYRLDYDSTIAEKPQRYRWINDAQALAAYQGYAYYSQADDNLVFDPFADTASGPAPKTSGASPPGEILVSLETAWGNSQMRLSADARELNVPFLPAPGSRAEMRLGGKSGYMVKKVGSMASIDEPVEIRSSRSGRATFALMASPSDGSGGRDVPHWRLFDEASGKIYDETAAAGLQILPGSRTFRLIAGDLAYVEGKTQEVLAGAPREIGLSQNFPNPFRGRTQVALDWPAWQEGERKAVLQVIDTRGRSVYRSGIGNIRFGRQVITLDASGWAPGLYLYRLTVTTGEKRATLQKRMLVSP